MRGIFFILFLFIEVAICRGQQKDTAQHHEQKANHIKEIKKPFRRIEYFKDTIHRERKKFDSTLFTKKEMPSTGDYAEDLGRVYQLLSKVAGITGSFTRLKDIRAYMDKGDTVLDAVRQRLSGNDRTLNVRNLQMFVTLLETLQATIKENAVFLNEYDTALDTIKKQVSGLRKDSLMLQIFRDSTLKSAFEPQLFLLKTEWRNADSLINDNDRQINTLKSQTVAHNILIGELLSSVSSELKATGSRDFGKEINFIWEPSDITEKYTAAKGKESIAEEFHLAGFYFSGTRSNRTWLLFSGILFFFWVWWNFRTLKKMSKLDSIKRFHTSFSSFPLAVSLVFMLTLAPLFDIHAPAIYVEITEILLMVVITVILKEKIDSRLFRSWCLYLLLFLTLPVTRVMGLPAPVIRWINLGITAVSVIFGGYFLLQHKKSVNKWILFSVLLYTVFNLLSFGCNMLGRITFSHLLADTAVYAVAQTISLAIFVQVAAEAFLLQMQTSRIKKGYPEDFDFSKIYTSVSLFVQLFAALIWLFVFSANMNVFNALYNLLDRFFTSARQVGSFTFTIGGAALFFGIICLANFLQKYIAYFFGDTGDDAAFDDKGQRTRLMVTRLIVLIGGFLMAVAASGLPVDRITVIIGALGVGVGLGLQNIVNNFVSGVILIFDRPLRIGDTVDIGDKRGRVKEIGIRSSTLLTEDGAEVIIPNGDVLSNKIVNWTLSNNQVRQLLTFNLETAPPGTDAMKEMVKKVENVSSVHEPEIITDSVNSKSITLKIYFWVNDFNKMARTAADVKEAVYSFLKEKNITVL